eukprot:4729265-Pyramimonas_sp.AAC.1
MPRIAAPGASGGSLSVLWRESHHANLAARANDPIVGVEGALVSPSSVCVMLPDRAGVRVWGRSLWQLLPPWQTLVRPS